MNNMDEQLEILKYKNWLKYLNVQCVESEDFDLYKEA